MFYIFAGYISFPNKIIFMDVTWTEVDKHIVLEVSALSTRSPNVRR